MSAIAPTVDTAVDTLIRVRRKRTAAPLTGLVISKKRCRSDPETRYSSVVLYRHVGSSEKADKVENLIGNVAVDEKVKFIEFAPGNEAKRPKLNTECVERRAPVAQVDELMACFDEFDITEKATTSDEKKSPVEVSDVTVNGTPMIRLTQEEEEYVYDFYYSKNVTKQQPDEAALKSEYFDVRVVKDDNDIAHYEGDFISYASDSDASFDYDSDDSNDENYYKNDYPDEESDDYDPDNDASGFDLYGYDNNRDDYEGDAYNADTDDSD